MILVITKKDDPHADFVISYFNRSKHACLRVNTEDFPQKITIDWNINNGKIDGVIHAYGKHKVKLSQISACWQRRPEKPVLDSSITDPQIRERTEDEVRVFLRDLKTCLADRFWINYPPHVLHAENKLSNLHIAQELGFKIPKTHVTNNPKSALHFIKDTKGEIVVKPFTQGFMQYEDKAYGAYTKIITENEIKNIHLVTYAPTMFQEYIEKQIEIRATIVGDKIFACEIHSQDSDLTKIDWRQYDFDNVKHKAHTLPKAIQEKLFAMLKKLQLNFGAFDLILTPHGEYVFLELNPNGQYLWIEGLTGMPISKAIADLLIEGSNNYIKQQRQDRLSQVGG